jgi:hypothetical protein
VQSFPAGNADAPLPTRELMLEYERKAEAAYSAMYDAKPWNEKDLKHDALSYLARALEVAEALGRDDDCERLRARTNNIPGVWNSQFRYTGR